VDIDTQTAVAPPIQSNGELKSEEIAWSNQAADAMEKVGNILIKESKTMREQDKPLAPADK